MSHSTQPRLTDIQIYLTWSKLREEHPGQATEFYHKNQRAIKRVLNAHARDELESKLRAAVRRVGRAKSRLNQADPRDVTTRIRFNHALAAMSRIQSKLRGLRLGDGGA